MRQFTLYLLFFLFFIPAAPSTDSPFSPLSGKIVVVDPGHGGYDPGAVRGEILEKNINLEIAQKLKTALEAKGAKVFLTRNGDYNLAIAGLHKREAHLYDLGKRLDFANICKADLFLSIHGNCVNKRSYEGAEAFYHKSSEKSKLLAECIQSELHLIPGIQKRTAKTSNCFLLRNAKIPASLVEVGYLSNPREKVKLLNSDYQASLAESISCGILKYLDQDTKKASLLDAKQ